jgi:uncharacterized membrane protein YtjA (UPF0391 family)
MSRWTLVFLIIVIVTGALALFSLEGFTANVAQVSALAFIVLFIISLMMHRSSPPVGK